MSHIFISYSRREIDFAQKIVDALSANKLDTWIDWKSIPKGEDWEQEIYRGIEEADAFLFLISPDSVASQMCNKEIAHAVKNGKRILPIVIRDADPKVIHPEISKRNWIFCRYKQELPDIIVVLDNFDDAIEETRKTIHTDYEWLKFHTELQVKALKWEQEKDVSRLLRGKELREAEKQLAEISNQEDPQPTKLQREYILTGRRNEERQRRQIIVWLSLGLILVATLAVFAWVQRNNAITSESKAINEANAKATALVGQEVAMKEAQTQKSIAINNLYVAQTQEANAKQQEAIAKQKEADAKRQALLALSDRLSTLALAQVDINYTDALLFGLESVHILEMNGLDPGNKSDILPTLLQKPQPELAGTFSRPPYGIVRKVVFDGNGQVMASASGSVDLWDTKEPNTPKLLMSWLDKNASDVVFSSDNKLLIVGCQDGSVDFFDVQALKEIGKFQVYRLNEALNVRVALKRDDKTLVVTGDGRLSIWDISDLTSPVKLFESLVAHKGLEITDLFFHPAIMNYLISVGDDKLVRVWDLQYPDKPIIQNAIVRNYGTSGVAISRERDANFVLVGGNFFDIYDGAFRAIRQFNYSDNVVGSIYNAITNASGNRLFAAGGDGTITEWDIAKIFNIKLIRTLNGHTNRVNSMAIHPYGDILVSGGNDAKITYWNLKEDPPSAIWTKKITSAAGINDISYNGKYNYLAVGEADDNLTLWNIADPTTWAKKISLRQPPIQVTFNPAQDKLVLLADNHGILDPSVSTLDLSKLPYSEKRWFFDLNTTDFLVFGRKYALAGDIDDGEIFVYVWDISNPLRPIKKQRVGVSPCPSLDSAYAPSLDWAAVISCNVQLWDFSGNKIPVLGQSNQLGAISSPRSVALDPDNRILAVGTGDETNSIQFWSITFTDSKIGTSLLGKIENPHLRAVTSLSFSSDGKTLVAGSEDQTLTLWDVSDIKNPKQRFTLKGHSNPILNGAAFISKDEKILISASKTEVILWNMDQDFWFQEACRIAGKNFSQREWTKYIGDALPYQAVCPNFPIEPEVIITPIP